MLVNLSPAGCLGQQRDRCQYTAKGAWGAKADAQETCSQAPNVMLATKGQLNDLGEARTYFGRGAVWENHYSLILCSQNLRNYK